MIRWIILSGLLLISAAFIGFGELEPTTEWIAKSIYITATLFLVISLILRDIQSKQVNE